MPERKERVPGGRVRRAPDGAVSEVYCPACESWLAPGAFGPSNQTRLGLRAYCMECYRSRNRARYAADPEASRNAMRDRHLRNTYGISREIFQQMEARQNGRCAICREAETAIGRHKEAKNLAVDHCHATGRVRGLLCQRCNLLLGWFEQTADILTRFQDYLRS